jgi:nucleotide-binding universal stress UspA family protein
VDKRMKLLIAYDGSSHADAALENLKETGLPPQVEAVVLSAADVWLLPDPRPVSPSVPASVIAAAEKAQSQARAAVEQAENLARQACQRLQADFPEWQVQAEAHANSAAWAIIEKAEAWPADLVVVGSHGASGLEKLILGSVSQKVVTEVRCSVRVARRRAAAKSGPLRLVVGLDGSPGADAAIQTVANRVWPADVEVHLITVADPRMLTAVVSPDHPAHQWIEPGDEDEWAWLYRMSAAASAKLQATGLTVSTLIKEGDPKQLLIEEAEAWGADCIFVGARGHRGLQRLLLGSVATAIAARAHCTVEVVRPKQSET